MSDRPKEEISEGVFVDVDPESVIKSQAAEITRLRAALADAQAVGFAAGVEAAADLAWSEEIDRPWEHWGEHRNMVTAQTVAKEIAGAIRALTPPDATAAAARLLPEKLFNAQINDACLSFRHDFGLMNDQKQASLQAEAGWWWTALRRAIAGDTP